MVNSAGVEFGKLLICVNKTSSIRHIDVYTFQCLTASFFISFSSAPKTLHVVDTQGRIADNLVDDVRCDKVNSVDFKPIV